MNERICRLCLKIICDNFVTIEALNNASYKLLLKLDLDVHKETILCNECMDRLQKSFHFILSCMSVKGSTKNDGSLILEEFQNTDVKSTNGSLDRLTCCFCKQCIKNEGFTSLLEAKESMFLVDLLRERISELNLNDTEEFLTCETCLDSLQNLSSFVRNCLEEKIRKCTVMEEVDDKGHIELIKVQKFTHVKPEINSSHVIEAGQICNKIQGFAIKVDDDLKCKDEMDNQELNVKIEQVDIKLEQNNDELSQEMSVETTIGNGKICSFECTNSSFSTHCTTDLGNHVLSQKIPSVVKKYKCEMCIYNTENRHKYRRHMLHHKNETHKCEKCPYETTERGNLRRHMLTHKRPSELTMFVCKVCGYKTKYKFYLKYHMLTHTDPTELKMHKCEMCPYETKHKRCLNQHIVIHNNSSETMHKCEMCEFETRHKRCLNKHMLTHRNSSIGS